MTRSSFIAATALAALLTVPAVTFAQSGSQTGGTATGGMSSTQSSGGASTPSSGTTSGPTATNAPPSAQTVPAMTRTGTEANTSTGGDENQQLSRNTLHNVQQQLQHQGYYKNAKVDGRWGPETRQAVERFQQAKGLPATGELDQQTLSALGVHQGG